MSTNANIFFLWFYYGLNNLGGWFIFLLLALTAVIWLLYDSGSRRLPAIGWCTGVVVTSVLLLPAILYRFTVTDLESMTTSPLAPFSEPIFYLGVMGGILPVVCTIGYFVSYWGLVGCPNGHPPYKISLGSCPECARLEIPQPGPVVQQVYMPAPETPRPNYALEPEPPPVPFSPSKHRVQAWLIGKTGDSHQLYQMETTIGRSPKNDIYLGGDPTVGRHHAKIMEQDGRFRLIDLGSKNHTRLNGRVLRRPTLLEEDDEIQFGDDTILRFILSRR